MLIHTLSHHILLPPMWIFTGGLRASLSLDPQTALKVRSETGGNSRKEYLSDQNQLFDSAVLAARTSKRRAGPASETKTAAGAKTVSTDGSWLQDTDARLQLTQESHANIRQETNVSAGDSR